MSRYDAAKCPFSSLNMPFRRRQGESFRRDGFSITEHTKTPPYVGTRTAKRGLGADVRMAEMLPKLSTYASKITRCEPMSVEGIN